MIFLESLFWAVFGLSAGAVVSGGVFSSLIAVGLIPRFAGKTHTGKKVFLYEEMVVLGTIIGSGISIFYPYINVKELFTVNGSLICGDAIFKDICNTIFIIFGTFAGIFVGCLAFAIAEMLNSIPIFVRRIAFRHGLGIAILSMALGKAAGSLIYFIRQIAK